MTRIVETVLINYMYRIFFFFNIRSKDDKNNIDISTYYISHTILHKL